MLEKAFEVLAVFKVVDEITKPINEMEKAVAGLKKSLENVSKSLEKLENAGKKMATFGAAITAPFAGAAYLAADFDKAMDEAATLVDMKLSEFRRLYDKQILQLAKETGQAPVVVAKAFYQAISAGMNPDEAISFLRKAGRSAIAGVSDIFTATDFLSTIKNAYGMTMKQLAKATDVVFATIKYGKTNFTELAHSFQYAGAAAAAAGVKFSELQAMVAVLTSKGISTERAYTGIKYAIENLISPSQQAQKAFKELGIDINALTVKKKGLIGTFEEIRKVLNALPEAERAKYISEIFGSVEAQDIYKSFATDPKRFEEVFQKIRNSLGATDKAFKKMAQSASFGFEQMKASMQTLAISIGTLLLPPLNALIEALNRVLKPITDFIQAHQTLAKVLVYPAVGAGLLLTALGSLAVVIGWVGKNLFDGILWLKVFYGHLQKTAFWSRVTAFAAKPLGEQLNLLNARFKALTGWGWSSLRNLYGWLKDLTIQLWRANIAVLRFTVATLRLQTIEQIKGAIGAVATAVGNLRKAVWGFIAANPYLLAFAAAALLIYKFWKPVKAFFSGLFEGLKEGFAEAFAPLKPVLSPIISAVKTLFGWIGRILKPLDDAEGGFQNVALAGKALGYAISKLIVLFAKLAIPVVNIVSIFTQLGSAIIDGLVKGIKKAAAKPVEAIKEVGKGILNGFKSLLGISSPSKLFMQFGHFLNEGLGIGLLKSLGFVKNAIGKVVSALHLPKITPQVSIPKLALEGLKALTLPVTLAASLLSPISALSLPVKQVERTFSTVRQVESRESSELERIVQVEKILQAEKVLRERFVSEKIVTERVAEKPSTVNLTLNFSPVINSKNKEEIQQVLQAYLPDFVRQVEEAIRKIEEQRARRSY